MVNRQLTDIFGNQSVELESQILSLPPFSPSFRSASVISDFGGSSEDDVENRKISNKLNQQQQMEDITPKIPLQSSFSIEFPQLGIGDFGSSDSKDSSEDLGHRPKNNQLSDYHLQTGGELEQEHQNPRQQHRYHSPSRLVSYSPSPIESRSTPLHNSSSIGFSDGRETGTPSHSALSPYDRANRSALSKSSTSTEDMATRSITGLESLVDQIQAAMLENEGGLFPGSGFSSHPRIQRSVAPCSPTASHLHPSSFQPYVSQQNHYVPSTSDLENSSLNYSLGPTDFSVNSMVYNNSSSNNSCLATAVGEAVAVETSPYFLDLLSASSLASRYDLAPKYSDLDSSISGNPYVQPGNTTQ